jgi:hypothetical protein
MKLPENLATSQCHHIIIIIIIILIIIIFAGFEIFTAVNFDLLGYIAV